MGVTAEVVAVLVVMVVVGSMEGGGRERVEGASWCVARSNVSDQNLQTALDYACGTGADCSPIQSTGLCFLPNTLHAHASYAFDSYYQRKFMAPGACDFSGTAIIAMTDPSYGSCVYPSSPSTAGAVTAPPGTTTPPASINNPNTPLVPTTTTPIYNGGVGGLSPDQGSTSSSTTTSQSSLFLVSLTLLLLLLFQTI